MKIKITGCSSYEYDDGDVVYVIKKFAPPTGVAPEGMVWNGVLGRFLPHEEAEEITRHGKVVDEKDLPLRRNNLTSRLERMIGYKDEVDIVKDANVDADVWKAFYVKYDVVKKVCCYDIGGDLVPNVTRYPSPYPDRYIEVYLDKTKECDNEELHAITKSLSKIFRREVEITSYPTVSKTGRVICRLHLPKALRDSENGGAQ